MKVTLSPPNALHLPLGTPTASALEASQPTSALAGLSTPWPLGNLPPASLASLARTAGGSVESLSKHAVPFDVTQACLQHAAAQAKLAWTEQAKMDFELAAAQLRVQELQAKRQLLNACTSGLALGAGGESRFENIMQSVPKLPSRPASPTELESLPAPPGLEKSTG